MPQLRCFLQQKTMDCGDPNTWTVVTPNRWIKFPSEFQEPHQSMHWFRENLQKTIVQWHWPHSLQQFPASSFPSTIISIIKFIYPHYRSPKRLEKRFQDGLDNSPDMSFMFQVSECSIFSGYHTSPSWVSRNQSTQSLRKCFSRLCRNHVVHWHSDDGPVAGIPGGQGLSWAATITVGFGCKQPGVLGHLIQKLASVQVGYRSKCDRM